MAARSIPDGLLDEQGISPYTAASAPNYRPAPTETSGRFVANEPCQRPYPVGEADSPGSILLLRQFTNTCKSLQRTDRFPASPSPAVQSDGESVQGRADGPRIRRTPKNHPALSFSTISTILRLSTPSVGGRARFFCPRAILRQVPKRCHAEESALAPATLHRQLVGRQLPPESVAVPKAAARQRRLRKADLDGGPATELPAASVPWDQIPHPSGIAIHHK